MAPIPDGWTDDMSIALPPRLRVEHVVEAILSAAKLNVPEEQVVDKLVALGLSVEDSALAYDRAIGGLVRASTGNPENVPSKDKDPIAYASFHRCQREPSLIAAIRPDSFYRQQRVRRWWQFWK
jgi:hypothetical protein